MSLQYSYPETGSQYVFSYSELLEDYERFCEMSDEDFLVNLPKILHFACIVAYVKEFGIAVVSDEGIIHQLVHLLAIPNEPLIDLRSIRAQFSAQLRLAR